MPRSGSELLQAILSQHPQIVCSTTSPLLEYFFAAAKNLSTQEASSLENAQELFAGFVKGGLDGYARRSLLMHREKPKAKLYIDKSRGWINYYNSIEAYTGESPPLICMVRDAAEVVASMEKLHLKSNFKADDPMKNVTPAERVDSWLRATPVGLAVRRIVNAIHELNNLEQEGKSRPFFFVRYEDLCNNPEDVLASILKHLKLKSHRFDLDNIEKVPGEEEAAFGSFNGLHAVKQKFEANNAEPKADEILGESLANSVREKCAAYQQAFGYTKQLTE